MALKLGSYNVFSRDEALLQHHRKMPSLIIAVSVFGQVAHLQSWNKYCQKNGVPFLPVFLNDLVGYIGPLTIPGETACFQCLLHRLNSNDRVGLFDTNFDLDSASARAVTPIHPAMLNVLAEVTSLEVFKHHALSFPFVGRLIEVNLLQVEVHTRKLLRVPRCAGCSNFERTPSVGIDEVHYFGIT
jgi:thiazole/oxazole-forming peptide maturase SagC family component